jgi:4-methyl-5(b-hydroxyethyl)-thiazole monophosphate biosynthesis
MGAMSGRKRVLVPLAEGFEEIEAVAIVDVLRRAEVEVVVAGLSGKRVLGAHGIALEADALLAEVDATTFDMLVLPGGMPGTTNLMADARVLAAVRELHARGRTTAAVCAAPRVLAAAGVLAGREVTSHPSVRGMLAPAEVRSGPRVVRSGTIVTSQGPGTSIEFALELVRELAGPERAQALAAGMLVQA